MIPSIIEYSDYVDFLNDFVQYKKGMNKGWSYNVWARQINITDPSLLRKVVKGSRSPNQEMAKKLTDYFKFTKEEADFFAVLIELRKTKIPDDKKEQILLGFKKSILRDEFKSKNRELIPIHTTFKHSALYAFATLNQGMSLKRIKKSFTIKMSDEELLETINDLIEFGLLEFDDHGKIVTSENAAAYVIKREQNATSEESLLAQQKATKSFVQSLYDNLFDENGKSYLSMNVLAKIPNTELENCKAEIKKAVLEVLFRYDQMDDNGEFELFNIYMGGFPAFKVAPSKRSSNSEKRSQPSL